MGKQTINKVAAKVMEKEEQLDQQRRQRRQQVEQENAELAAKFGVAREELSFIFA